jgi:copper transport protein
LDNAYHALFAADCRQAVRLALYRLQLYPQRAKSSRLVNNVLPWANLILGLALFTAIAMSSHAAAVSIHIADWLHLVAAALWVGGMMYIATSYLPILRTSSITEQTFSLITLLPYYTHWAITGIVIMAVTGPFSAAVQLSSWQQLLTTPYGRALMVKILLVGGCS